VVAIAATGLIHLGDARDAFGEATYKGLLFVANSVGALVAGGAFLGTCSVAPSACRVCRPSPMPGSNHSGSPPW
jgi:hypothetical protein